MHSPWKVTGIPNRKPDGLPTTILQGFSLLNFGVGYFLLNRGGTPANSISQPSPWSRKVPWRLQFIRNLCCARRSPRAMWLSIWLRQLITGWNPAPVEVGRLSHYLKGFIHPKWLALGFLNHQQYHLSCGHSISPYLNLPVYLNLPWSINLSWIYPPPQP